MIEYRKKQFRNVCLLYEVISCMGVSNSIVEGGFSQLTCLLTDRRLSLNHNTMENLLLIKANHLAWSDTERSEIIEDALNKHMKTKRKLQIDSTAFNMLGVPVPKRQKLEVDDELAKADSGPQSEPEYMEESSPSDESDDDDDELEPGYCETLLANLESQSV